MQQKEKEWVSFAKLDFDSLHSRQNNFSSATTYNKTPQAQMSHIVNPMRCGFSNPTHAKPFL